MRILILGATGMLGHRLMIELSKHHEVFGTTRSGGAPLNITRERTFPLMLNYPSQLKAGLSTIKPDVVINCAAAIPQSGATQSEMVRINALMPHDLAIECEAYNARLIHFSTDGVFSGKRGNYSEDDTPDATDVYGMTKRLGEIADKPHVLTLRCCPIGREIGAKKSLVEWFLAQTGTIDGYRHAECSPLTTHEIARILNEYILPRPELAGVYHLPASPIQKYYLLQSLNEAYKRGIQINYETNVKINRTLDATRFKETTGYVSQRTELLITQMAADNALYEGAMA